MPDWHGCYDASWKGLIVDEAFAHPAKFARGLIERIIEHGLEKGYWKPGSVVGDPFGGVGLGGIICASKGIRWVGIELEQHFCDMGAGCICMGISRIDWVRFYGRWGRVAYSEGRHWCPGCLAEAKRIVESPQRKLFTLESASYLRDSGRIPSTSPHRYIGNLTGNALAHLVQGDSRRFAEIVGEVCGVVTSPPFQDQLPSHDNFVPPHDTGKRLDANYDTAYGTTPGQIGSLPAGELDGAIASPPYAEGQGHGGNPTPTPHDTRGTADAMQDGYGAGPGQIGSLPPGALDAVITSPPYAESVKGDHAEQETAQQSRDKRQTPGGSLGRSARFGGYGSTPGNIGNLKEGEICDIVKTAVSSCADTGNQNDATPVREKSGAGGGLFDPKEEESPSLQASEQITQTGGGAVNGDGEASGNLSVSRPSSATDSGVCSASDPPGLSITSGQEAQPVSGTTPSKTSRVSVEAATPSSIASGAEGGTQSSAANVANKQQSARQTPSFAPSDVGQMRKIEDDAASAPQHKEGSLDGAVTSPPYQGNRMDGGGVRDMDAPARKGYVYHGMRDGLHAQYGQTDGQISGASETYWGAMSAVYRQMWLAMKPGALAAIVLKDYVKAGKRVPLCDDTCRLLESVGFEVFERTRAWLVKETVERGLFGDVTHRKERKSFFRRLAEKKGSPRIDWEMVIWARKLS